MNTNLTPNSISTHAIQMDSLSKYKLANKKRIIAFIAPPILVLFMYPVFRLLEGAIGNSRIAWYLGLVSYWLIWGAVFPIMMIGVNSIERFIKPQKLNLKIILLLAIPLVGAVGAKLVPGMGEYDKPNMLLFVLIISTAFGNGFFEEILWRGMYVKLFPKNIFFRMIWPSIWFGIWHYVPVSINNHELSGLVGMIVGPLMMGLYLSYLTNRTNTLWWAIVAHTIGGLIMVL